LSDKASPGLRYCQVGDDRIIGTGVPTNILSNAFLPVNNEKESRRGKPSAAYLKLTPVFIFMVPGMACAGLTKMASSGSPPSGDESYTALLPKSCLYGIRGMRSLRDAGIAHGLPGFQNLNASAALFTIWHSLSKWHPTGIGADTGWWSARYRYRRHSPDRNTLDPA